MSTTPFEDPPIAELDDAELLAAIRKRLATAHQLLETAKGQRMPTTGDQLPAGADDRTTVDGLPDAPPPDKQTPQNFESEGGASPDGPVAIT